MKRPCDGLVGPPRGRAATRPGTVLGNKTALLQGGQREMGALQGSPLREARGALGWRGEDCAAEVAFSAVDMWRPVLPFLRKQPELSKGGSPPC